MKKFFKLSICLLLLTLAGCDIVRTAKLKTEGDECLIKKDYHQAIHCYKKAIEVEPDYAEAYSGCGVSYLGLGDYKSAFFHFRQAVLLKPSPDNEYNLNQVFNAFDGQYHFVDNHMLFEKIIEILGKPDIEIGNDNTHTTTLFYGTIQIEFLDHKLTSVKHILKND